MKEADPHRRLRYAMIGGGAGSFIGPIHRAAIRLDDLADFAGGCLSRADGDWRTFLNSVKDKVDFVSVCTPNDSHFEIAKAAMECELDVFCEKPLALSLDEAETLAATAEKYGCILAIPFTYSGFPMVKLAKDLVAKGELGRIDRIVVEYLQGSFRKIDFAKPLDKRNAWKMNPNRAGKSCVVADIGVHAFHLIEYVTGLQIAELLADLSSYAPGNTLDDDASILMRLKDSNNPSRSADTRRTPKASIAISKIATGEENGVRLRVYGDKASLFWNQETPNYLSVKSPFGPERIYKRNAPYIEANSPASKRSSRIPAGHHEGFIEAFANIYDEFCAAVRDRKPHDFPSVAEGVRTMRYVEAALASDASGNTWSAV